MAAPLPVVRLCHGCRARERRLGVGILRCRGVCGRWACVAACRGRKHLRHFVGAFRSAHVHKLAAVAQEPQLLSVAIVFLGRCGMAAELPRLCLTVAWSDRQGAQPAPRRCFSWCSRPQVGCCRTRAATAKRSYSFFGAMRDGSSAARCFGSVMDAEHENAGLASAFFGAVGYVAGGLASPLVGAGNIFITSSVLFVLLTSTSWLLSHKSRNS